MKKNLLLPIFSFGALFTLACATYTFFTHPLYQLKLSDNDWTRAWMWMTTLDYYGAAACLSAVALFTEERSKGLAWTAAFCLLGSPACCAYLAYRLATDKGLKLDESHRK